ncbi:FliO/MopB family protein [Desulfobulbus rhabdoformis]|uniref:FliO/MopB family protein n=1 Tax=Desulfobulbus rhabdoformis TaxID=34032 RepID=UPI001965DFAC|nr:flagellar biosynthetic protein FliO [Desulfobulbus rhabdoformis]MBM9616488.1 FliO/MopB family protein [Desulfobulbus rhabdoformis]
MATAALQTLWALCIVVGLILAFYALAKKRFVLGKRSGTNIRIIEIRPLQPKATLALVEVRGREFLLGINSGNIQLLTEMNPDSTGDKPKEFSSILAEEQ